MRPRIGILCSLAPPDTGGGSPRDMTTHAYGAVVEAAGGAPLLIPCASADAIASVLRIVDGLIITGGCDVDPLHYGQEPHPKLGRVSPERDLLDETVVEHVLETPQLPVLAICRGIQCLNVFAGGSLIQDIPSQVENAIKHSQDAPRWYPTHEVNIVGDSELAATVGAEALRVNSFHHQAVGDVAPGFCVVAETSDGVIEAIERQHARYCIGLQCHPELMAPAASSPPAAGSERVVRLFERLIAEAREYGAGRADGRSD